MMKPFFFFFHAIVVIMSRFVAEYICFVRTGAGGRQRLCIAAEQETAFRYIVDMRPPLIMDE